MKLHLPKPLRNSVLACIAAVAGIATPTLGTATFAGGVVAFTLASQQAAAVTITAAEPWSTDSTVGEDVTLDGAAAVLTISGGTHTVSGKLELKAGASAGMSDGELNITQLHLHNAGGASAETFTLSGGTVNISYEDNGVENSSRTGDVAIVIGHWNGGRSTVTVENGTLNALNGTVRLGWDSTGVLNISGGEVNVKGITYRADNDDSRHTYLTGGRLNLGTVGVVGGNYGDIATFNMTGGTIGALTADGWTLDATKVKTNVGTVTVDTTVAGGTEAANITWLGTLNAAESGINITLAGSGSLTLDRTLDGMVLLAENSTAKLRAENLLGFDYSVEGDAYGDTGASGLNPTFQIAGAESTVNSLLVGDSTEAVALENGAYAMNGTFLVADNVTYDDVVASAGSILISENGKLTYELGNADVKLNEILPDGKIESQGVIQVNTSGVASLSGTLTVDSTLVVNAVNGFNSNSGEIVGAGTLILNNSGESTLIGGDQLFKATNLTVGKGTTLKIGSGDAIQWNDNVTRTLTVLAGGILNLDNKRLTLGRNNDDASKASTIVINIDGGTIKGQGDEYGGLDFLNGATINVTKSGVLDTPLRVRNNKTVTYNIASGACLVQSSATAADNIGNASINGGGVLDVQGNTNVKKLDVAQGSTLRVSNGAQYTVSNITSNGQSVQGNIEVVGENSKFILSSSGHSDFLKYDGIASIYVGDGATFDFGANRATMGPNNILTLNGGTVTGAGQGTSGALDYFNANNGRIVSDGNSTISAAVRVRDHANNLAVQVNSGTLTFSGTYYSDGTRKWTKSGSGVLNLASSSMVLNGLDIAAGSVTIAGVEAEDGTVTSSAVTLKGTSNLSGSITVQKGGSLTFADGAVINVDVAGMTRSGTYTDINGTTGDNGFFSGSANVITGAFTKEGGLTVQLYGENTTNYTISDKGLVVNTSAKNVYYVNKGTVTAVDAITETNGFSRYHVAAGATLNLAGNYISRNLADVQGAGTVVLSSDLNLANGTRTGFAGNLKVNQDATLEFGASGDNGVSFENFDYASLSSIQLNGGAMRINYADLSLNKVNVLAAGSVLHVWDYSNAAYEAGKGFRLNTLALDADATLRASWKSNININLLTGSGNLTINRTDGDTSNINIGSFKEFTGSLNITAGNHAANINATIKKDETLRLSGISGANAKLNLAGAGKLDLGTTQYTSGLTVTDNWTGTVRVGGVDDYYTFKNPANSNNPDLNGFDSLGNEMSTVLVNGVSGWIGASVTPGDTETITTNLQLQNLSETVDALRIHDGSSWQDADPVKKYTVFAGSVSGDGNIRLEWSKNLAHHFYGDISGWTGTFYNAGAGKSIIVLDKKASHVKASIDRTYNETNSNIQLTVNNQATFANKVNVTSLTLGENAGITLAQGSSLEVVNGTTIAAGQSLATTAAGIVMNSALTFDGGSLTLGGALNLGDKVLTLSTTNKTALTLADGMVGENVTMVNLFTHVTDVLGITGITTGVKLDSVFDVDSSLADLYLKYNATEKVLMLASIIAETREWTQKDGVNAGTWAEGAAFGATGATDAPVFAENDYAVFGSLAADHTVTIGAPVDTAQGTAARVDAGSLTVNAGAGKKYTFTGGEIHTPLLTITSGTAEFTANTLQLSELGEESVSIAKDGVLDLSAYDVSIFQQMYTKATGEGTIVLNEGQVMLTGDQSIDVNTQIDGDELRLNAINAGTNAVVTLNKALSYTDATNSFLRLESGAKLLVADNGVLEVGKVELGHEKEAGNVGHLEIATGGTVTAGSVVATTGSGGGTLVVNGGTLELTGTEGIAAGISTTINAGTLVAKEASWSITGATIGGWDAVNNAPKVTISGTQTITLTNAKLTSTLKNTGNLNLAGTINISNTEAAAFQTTKNGADWFSTTGDAKGNGFRFATLDYTIATGTGTVTTADGLKWSLNGTELTSAQCKLNLNTTTENSSDNVTILTVMGQRQDTLYWVNSGTENYGGADGAVMTGATGIALNGGILQLNTTLTGLNIERKGTTGTASDGTINLNGTGVTLTAAQVTGTGSATLTGNGVYDLGTVTNLGNGITIPNALKVSLGQEWKGTVRVSGTIDTAHMYNLGNANSWIQINGLSGKGRHNVSSGVELTGDGYTITGFTETDSKFMGAVKGSADFTIKSADGDAMNYVFSGNTAAWSGGFVVAQHESTATPTVSVELTGGNDVFATGAKGIEMNRAGTLNVTIGNTEKSTTMNGGISKIAGATLNLTTVGEVKMVGTLADGIGLTNNGKLELTQEAATLASLAGTGSVTAKSLTLQAATNTVGTLNLGSLTLGANVTSLKAGELKISGDVVVNKVAANFLTSTGLAADSMLNLNIAESLLQDYMSTANTTSVQLATVTGLTLDLVTLNKGTGWNGTDHTWTTSDDQYTYALKITDGVLTLNRATNGIIWNGEVTTDATTGKTTVEKWVMDTTTKAWKTKGDTPDDLAYGTVQSTIFNGSGAKEVVVSGDVTTTNVTFDVTEADIDGYTFTDDADTADADSLTIEKNLSINGGELKIQVSTNVGGRTEVGQDGQLTLAMPSTEQNPYMEIGAGLINRGAVTVNEGTVVYVGDPTEQEPDYSSYVTNNGKMTVEGMLGVVGSATNAQQASLTVGQKGMVTAASVSNAGMISSTGTIQTQTMQNAETGALKFTSGAAYIGADPTATNLSNAGEITVSGASVAVTGGVDNDGVLSVTGGSLTTGVVDNNGSIAVTGGSLSTGNVDNDGTLSVAGGSMTVTGNLDNRNKGSIAVSGGNLDITDDAGETITTVNNLDVTGDLLNADGNLSITGEGTKVAVGGNLQMQEVSAEDDTLLTGTLTVGEKTSLTVGGDLAAADMKLGFDGSVTVGGSATAENITIAKGASFTAENATITGTLANDGVFSVTTTVVVDEKGNPVLDKDNNMTYTGGQLTIGTLTGSGEVHVAEGGALTIKGSMTEFTGLLDNKGSMTFDTTGKTDDEGNPIDAVVTLGNTQLDGHTAGDITTDALKVSADAVGYQDGSYVMGDVVTDTLIIDNLDAAGSNARLSMSSLSEKTAASKVALVLSEIETGTVTSGSYHIIELEEGLTGTLADNLDLSRYGYNASGEYEAGATAAQSEYMQALLKNNTRVYFSDTDPAATVALLSAGIKNVYAYIGELSSAESTWTVGDTSTVAGLKVLNAGKLVANDILNKVQNVKVNGTGEIDLTGDISEVKLNNLSATKSNSTLTIKGDAADKASITTVGSGFTGAVVLDKVSAAVSGKLDTVKLTNKAVANLAVTDTDVEALTSGLTLNGSMKGGKLSISKAAGVKGTLKIDGTDLNIAYDDGGKLTMSTANVATTGQVLVDMGSATGEAGDIFIGKGNEASKLMEKYFTNVRFEDNKGVVADRNTVYYTSKLTDSASSDNGKAGLAMADESLLSYNPQNTNPTGDLAKVLEKLDEYVTSGNKAAADELGASLAGASTAVLGMAAMGDVDRQLRAIRNRTTTMGVDQSVVNADMPYFNAWINAEGDSREMGEDGTLGGYKLNSYGGTVGFDVDIEPTLTAGMALTAMYGDLDATGTDKATGNLDSYYVSAFARYCGSAWTHTFVGTIGMGDISLDRTVGSAQVKGETDSMSFGLMYEVGRVYALDEDGTTCLQPVFNVTWKHTTVDAYTEKGSDVALSVDEQSLDTITFGLGARLQTVVGESMYNRTSIFECRLLAKADAGDTEGTSKVALGSSATHEVKSNEMGAIGIEVGAGLTIPLGDEGSSIFMDASAEIRADYTDVNGTVGYRVNF